MVPYETGACVGNRPLDSTLGTPVSLEILTIHHFLTMCRVDHKDFVKYSFLHIYLSVFAFFFVPVLRLLKEGADLNTVISSGGSLLHLVRT